MSQCKRYTKQFKEEAIRPVRQEGMSLAQLANDLGLDEVLKNEGIICSMGGPAKCCDNAVAESFFANLTRASTSA